MQLNFRKGIWLILGNTLGINAKWGGEGETDITIWIQSFPEKYKTILEIKKSKLVYVGDELSEEYAWASELGMLPSTFEVGEEADKPAEWTQNTSIKAVYVKDGAGFAIIPLPNNFTISTIATEQDINTGVVIIDEKGNEFVWIPVDDFADFTRAEWSFNETVSELEDSLEATWKEPFSIKPTEQTEMENSVQKYKGYYVAKYEMSRQETTGDTGLESSTTTGTPMSKPNQIVWNYIPWGGTSTKQASDGGPGNDSADGAVKVSRQMYTGNESDIQSTLIYGVQWDYIMKWLSSSGINVSNGVPWGNYIASSITSFNSGARHSITGTKYNTYVPATAKSSGTPALLTTGAAPQLQKNNIYDLGGNVYEWTMEAASDSTRSYRGYNFDDATSSSLRPSYRRGIAPNNSRYYIGFRVTLYVK